MIFNYKTKLENKIWTSWIKTGWIKKVGIKLYLKQVEILITKFRIEQVYN